VPSGINCRIISVGPLPVSRMARVVRSKPSVRNNLTTSLKLEEGTNAHAVPSGGFPWDTPSGRLGQFFPASRKDLYLLAALLGSECLRLPRRSAEACSRTASGSFKAVNETRDGVNMELRSVLRASRKTAVGLMSKGEVFKSRNEPNGGQMYKRHVLS